MTEGLTISTHEIKGRVPVTVFHLRGALDVHTEPTLHEKARQACESGTCYLLVDLKDVEMITSAGLRCLHTLFKMLTPREEIEAAQSRREPYKSPYFKLAAASPHVYYTLNIAGFLHNIPIYSNLQDALDSFGA